MYDYYVVAYGREGNMIREDFDSRSAARDWLDNAALWRGYHFAEIYRCDGEGGSEFCEGVYF
jgi:hypothetical protein